MPEQQMQMQPVDTPVQAPPAQDTPLSQEAMMANDLQGAAPQGAAVADEVVPERLMRDDYLRRLNALKAREEELNQKASQVLTREDVLAMMKEAAGQGQQQAPPAEKFNIDDYKPHPWFKEVAGLEFPAEWDSDGEALLAKGLSVTEKMIDGLHNRITRLEQENAALRSGVEAQNADRENSIVSGALNTITQTTGVQVRPDELKEAWALYGAQVMKQIGVQVPTSELLTHAWAIYSSLGQARQTPTQPVPPQPAPQGQPSAPRPPAMSTGNPQRGSQPPMTDEEMMLADMAKFS